MGIVIGAVAVVFVLALIIFPGVRGKLKVLVGGFLNIFVEDIAKTPEGAKAVFQQAIEEVQERYNKAGDTLNRFVGEQSSVQKNLNQAVPPPKCQWLRKMRRKLSRMLICSLSPQSITGSRLFRLHGLASPSTLLNPK